MFIVHFFKRHGYCIFFQDFEIYSRLCVSVCTLNFTLGPPDSRSNSSAAAELAEFRKITIFKGKNTIFNETLIESLR